MVGAGGQIIEKAHGCVSGYGVVPAHFLSLAADVLVGVGLGCLLQISRGHVEVKVSGQTLLQRTSLPCLPSSPFPSSCSPIPPPLVL